MIKIKKKSVLIAGVGSLLTIAVALTWTPEKKGRLGLKLNPSDPDQSPEAQMPFESSDSTQERSEEVILNTPSVDQVRQEVAHNPHTPPISIIDFAAQLGPKMERALESEEVALSLFEEITQCALDFSSPITVQAICLSNAQLLAKTYTKLEAQFSLLMEQAKNEAVQLIYPSEQ